MKRSLLIIITVLLYISSLLNPGLAWATDVTFPERHLNISTIDSRPIFIDRLLYTALTDIDYQASFVYTTAQGSLDSANQGEVDGVISMVPDLEQDYHDLIQVPVVLEYSDFYAYVRNGQNIEIADWGSLAGLKVGIISQRPYTQSRIPADTTVTTKDTIAMLMDGLLNGEYDVAVLTQRTHEMLTMPEGVTRVKRLERLPEYLYLHPSRAALLPQITAALENIFDDGRAEKILSDIALPAADKKKTILHIISTNTEVMREELFRNALRENFENDDTIEWYTVAFNANRFSGEPNRLVYFANLLRQDSISRNIAAIVVSGNEAMDFMQEHYWNLFRNVPVLFYSLGEDHAREIESFRPYFTGVVERPEIYDTVMTGLHLFPGAEKLYVINDYTPTGQNYRRTVESQLESLQGVLDIEYSADVSREAILARIKELPEQSLVFVGSYFRDASGQYYSLNEMKRALNMECDLPIFSLYSTEVDYGAVGGRCLDYERYGNIIASMLARVLAGEEVRNIEMDPGSADYSRWVFDKTMLDKWEIAEKALPSGSEIVNKTPSIWQANPNFAYSVTALLFLSVIVIVGLFSFLHASRRKNTILLETRKHLHTAEELLVKDAKIREVKERLELIINTAPVAFVLSVDGMVIDVNEYMEKHVGMRPGCMAVDFYSDPTERDRAIDSVNKRQQVLNDIISFDMLNGESHRFLANYTDADYEGQRAIIFWGVDIEQAERQNDQLKLAQQSLQSVLNMLPVAVRIFDIENNTLIYANRACMEMFKAESIDNYVGNSIEMFTPHLQPDGITSMEKLAALDRTAEPTSAELVCVDLEGETFDTLITALRIDFYGKPVSLGIIEDLTAEKEYQAKLLSAAEKEREANQLKSRFLVNMSHEIRTPMNAIIGLTEIELRKNAPKEAADIYKKINISAKNLLQIINDILDLSKIEADKLELFIGEFDLEDVINSALLVATPRLDGKQVEFMLKASMDLPRFVIGDKTRLWQILKNFLDNAAKFTDKGRIILSASVDAQKSDAENVRIVFVVEDTGIGITEQQMKKLFMPYKQFYNEAQQKYSGTGLGMPISKQLCELMGGGLHIESREGVGTVITVSIPFKRSANTETALHTVKAPELAGIKALLVDDDETSLEIMSGLLSESGAHCVSACSGAEAMRLLFEHRARGEVFDIILLDYMMEGLNGLDTARQIQMSLSRVPKLLMVTAYQKQLLKSDLERYGIGDLIEKPFIPSQFMRKVCAALGYGDEKPAAPQAVFTMFKDARVLLVEDNRMNQEVAVGMCAQFGIKPTLADNGSEALDILRIGPDFDLVFMDLQMPVMDGFEATRAIRADERFKAMPVISLTADAMTEVADKCREAGMNDYITKPIEFDSLHAIFLKWLPQSKRIGVSVTEGVASAQPAKSGRPGWLDPEGSGLRRFAGKKELYERSLLKFAQDLPEAWPDFASAIADAEKTRQEVHKLKGLAGNLSVMNVYQGTVDFEASLRENRPDASLYQRLVDAALEAKKYLNK